MTREELIRELMRLANDARDIATTATVMPSWNNCADVKYLEKRLRKLVDKLQTEFLEGTDHLPLDS